jgi:hypothetical protein
VLREVISESLVKNEMFDKESIRYLQHVLLKQHFTMCEKEIISDLTESSCFLRIDFKMKIISEKHIESKAAYFGKGGLSLLGIQSTYKELTEYYDCCISDPNNCQDQIMSLATVETFLKKYLIENPSINEIWISSDNGRHFTGNFFLIGLMLLVEKFSTPKRKLVFHFIKSEPDTKSTLDCHFSFISMVIHNFKQINDLNNAEDVFLH